MDHPSAPVPMAPPAGPALAPPPEKALPNQARLTSLDAVRGIALLGILVMNAVSFGLAESAYVNLSADGSDTWLDWIIGGAAAVFVDQKMMGLFSLLFGAGVVMFADRAFAKGRRPAALSLWRFALLLVIGFLHSLLWEGDILMAYAVCAPVVLLLRNIRPRISIGLGSAAVAVAIAASTALQFGLDDPQRAIGEVWSSTGSGMADSVGILLLADVFLRALGLMLVGVGLFRVGIVQGTAPPAVYHKLRTWGLGVGVPIAVAGLALNVASDWSGQFALAAHALNTAATVPMVLGYVGAIVIWRQRTDSALRTRVDAVGRMALTNYLAQTVLGVLVLTTLLGEVDLTRTAVGVFIMFVWTLQLLWSKAWLDRFRFGPAEWLWRAGTYRTLPPFRR